eukprot:TRINITY_DN7751_c0_g1_i2.p1 TRINITY_DN7751_c0_g1~~TRINITY_DN7751_c0_g1_i2.p1  ORF type:complete len:280 (+),score=25.60 TRINITY_DN7751_c0_g1_i2:212-1051(+)
MDVLRSTCDYVAQTFLGWTPSSPPVSLISKWPEPSWPSPVGLSLGLACVTVGQIATLAYFYVRREIYQGAGRTIQKGKSLDYNFWEGVGTHLAQPEGLILLGSYLTIYWMSGTMPWSYYTFEGGVNWHHVLAQLVIQDCIQTLMHLGEHAISAEFYKKSHKPHHRWINPRLFDAFNGSMGDTICMILVPLFITSRLVYANVWSYMAFGTTYSMLLTLIHSEYAHPWDRYVRWMGVGTAADHHVHHKLFKYNYGHIFMWWDWMLGTYRHPDHVKQFNQGV